MTIHINYSLNQVVTKTEPDMIVPIGVVSIYLDDQVIFEISGDLITTFDTILSESIKVILNSQTTGRLYSLEDPGLLSLSLNNVDQLKVDIFEDSIRLEDGESLHTVFVNPTYWLLNIANAFRDFQNLPHISKETVLRHNRGATIPLLEVLM